MLGSYLKITLIFIKYIDYSLLNYLFGFNLLGFNLFSFNLFRFSLFGFNLFKFNLLRFNLPGFSLRRGISLCRGFSHRWFSRRWFSRRNCEQKFPDKLLPMVSYPTGWPFVPSPCRYLEPAYIQKKFNSLFRSTRYI